MTSQTLTRRSVLTTDDVAANVLKAPARGDLLRKVRDVHPQGDRLTDIAAAEAAVAETARMLENLTREHQQNLDRVNILRSRQELPALSAPTSAPDVREVGDETALFGRVTERGRLSTKSRISGTLRLMSGEEIRWSASTAYVDSLDPLFDGVPVEVRAARLCDGTYVLRRIQAAPRSFWTSDAQYAPYADLGPMTVMAGHLLKKQLRQHTGKCRGCHNQLPKRASCSLIDTANGTRIICRSCKQDWIDAGRPTVQA